MLSEAQHRMIVDSIKDEWLIKPVNQLNGAQQALLQAAFGGPFGEELIERLDRIIAEQNNA